MHNSALKSLQYKNLIRDTQKLWRETEHHLQQVDQLIQNEPGESYMHNIFVAVLEESRKVFEQRKRAVSSMLDHKPFATSQKGLIRGATYVDTSELRFIRKQIVNEYNSILNTLTTKISYYKGKNNTPHLIGDLMGQLEGFEQLLQSHSNETSSQHLTSGPNSVSKTGTIGNTTSHSIEEQLSLVTHLKSVCVQNQVMVTTHHEPIRHSEIASPFDVLNLMLLAIASFLSNKKKQK